MEMNKLIGNKIKLKQMIFIVLVLNAVANIIFFTFFHEQDMSNMLYYTYQSNLLVLIYYLFLMLGFYLMRAKISRRLFSTMDHHLLKIFIGTNIVVTGIAAVFLIGPFTAIYHLLDANIIPPASNIFTVENIYLGFNTVMLHVVIPLLVLWDFSTDSVDSWRVSIAESIIPLVYLISYLILVLVYGANTGIYPYLPVDPTAYDIIAAKYAIPIISWFVIFSLLMIVASGWVYSFSSRNPINLQKEKMFNW